MNSKLHDNFTGACIAEHEACFIQCALSVVSKQGKTVPFIFNQVQKFYEKQKSRFDFILKSRKLGMSTRIIAGDIWACAFKKNQHAILLSHTDEAGTKLLEERVKPILRSSVIPLGAVERAGQIYFPATNSRYYIGTSGSKSFGRGDDITRYHLSEYAWWEKPTVITGIEEACIEGAVGRIETTANGTNFAQLDWRKASTGQSRYKPVFIPWFLDPDYSIPGGQIDGPDEIEKQLIEAYGLSQPQLAWRRDKIRSMTQPELFVQEYPSNAEEAFLSSGRMVFDWVSLIAHEKRCIEPRWVGGLRDMGDAITFQPNEQGNLKIWKSPVPRHTYVIGADIAEGLKDGAYSAAFVFDVGTSEQVAEWHGHIDADRFGDVLVLLGLYYNTALLAPEAWPGPGQVTIARIMQVGYSNVYKRAQRSNRTEDQSWGWQTDQSSKPQMIHSFAAAARDFNLVINSKDLLLEMRSLEYDEAGKIGPSLGCFSDRVMAAGIAWYTSRDIASRPINEAQKLKNIEGLVNRSGFASVPQWRGSRAGVRPS